MKITVESAVELKPNHKKALLEKFKDFFGESVELEYVIDPLILGGLRISTPNKIVDLSLQAKLNQLSNELLTK